MHHSTRYRPYLGGWLVRATGTILTVIYINLIIVATCLVLVVLFIPESLPAKQAVNILEEYEAHKKKTGSSIANKTTTESQERRVAWHSHIFHSLRFFKPNGQNTNLILLAAISFLQMLVYRGTLSVIVLYTNKMFNWTEYEVSDSCSGHAEGWEETIMSKSQAMPPFFLSRLTVMIDVSHSF